MIETTQQTGDKVSCSNFEVAQISKRQKAKHKWWQTLVNKGRENFVASDESRICSNHFVDGKPTEKHCNPDYPGQQALSFSFLWLCFILDQKTLPAINHAHQSID